MISIITLRIHVSVLKLKNNSKIQIFKCIKINISDCNIVMVCSQLEIITYYYNVLFYSLSNL